MHFYLLTSAFCNVLSTKEEWKNMRIRKDICNNENLCSSNHVLPEILPAEQQRPGRHRQEKSFMIARAKSENHAPLAA